LEEKMKKLFVLCIILCVTSFATAALALNIEDVQRATLFTDGDQFLNCYLSIPSDIDHFIEPGPPISLYFDGTSDGLDWYFISNAYPLIDPIAGPLATIHLTDVEWFVDTSFPPYKLNLWDETAICAVGSGWFDLKKTKIKHPHLG
jgi:hypothetical protein